MADGKTGKTLNLTEGNPLKLILLFAIPVFLGRLFQMMYSLIDTKIVGSILGEEALAAVGSVSILYNLLTGIFSGFTLGFSIVTAQNYGSGNEKLLKCGVFHNTGNDDGGCDHFCSTAFLKSDPSCHECSGRTVLHGT